MALQVHIADTGDPEIMKEVFDRMVRRMRNYAIMASGQVSPRTLIELERLRLADDLFDEKPPAIGHDLPVEILNDPNHGLRSKFVPGPLFLFRTSQQEKFTVIELPVLLLSELRNVREAAFREIERLLEDSSLALLPKSVGIIREQRDLFFATDDTEWRKAAIRINDALHDDFLLALQGAKQSMAFDPVPQESIDAYMPRVLYPTGTTLESFELTVEIPVGDHNHLSTVISSIIASSDTLASACSQYMTQLGYLPLVAPFSLGELVRLWLEAHQDCCVWDEVWGWTSAAFGPLPYYHACAVFVLHPEWIPEGKHLHLWQHILLVLNQGSSGENQDFDPRWTMRHQLTRHFLMLLEPQHLGKMGESVACMAWKLAELVMEIFPDNAESVNYYQSNWLSTCLNISSSVWLNAQSRVEHSHLRCMTATATSPWAISLMALMGPVFDELRFDELNKEMQNQFRNAVHRCLLISFPYAGDHEKSDVTYPTENGFGMTVSKWLRLSGPPDEEDFRQLLLLQQSLMTPNGMRQALDNIETRPTAEQFAVGMALKVDANSDALLGDTLWEFLSNAEWRNRAFKGIDVRVVSLFCEILLAYQSMRDEKWFVELPHFFAVLCEQEHDLDRHTVFFIAAVQLSMGADSYSAVQRIMRGKNRAIFVPMAQQHIAHLESIWEYHPAWAQSRLRAAVAALSSYSKPICRNQVGMN